MEPCPSNANAAAANDARAWRYTVGYLGELAFHPGVIAGVELPVRSRVGTIVVASNVGTYVHVRNHVGASIDVESGYRYTLRRVTLDALAGIGYLHTFLAAPVYEVDDAGEVTRTTDLGRPSFMPMISVGVGLALARFAPYLRIVAFGQYPFNRHLLPHAAVVLGVRL